MRLRSLRPTASRERLVIACALMVTAACADEGNDAGNDASNDADAGLADGAGADAAPVLTGIEPPQGPFGTYLTLTGTDLLPAGQTATLLLDGREVATSDAAPGDCVPARAHCVRHHGWTNERITIVLPVTVAGGALSVRTAAGTSPAVRFDHDEVARPTGGRIALPDVGARSGNLLVLAHNDAGTLVVRIVSTTAEPVVVTASPGAGALAAPLVRARDDAAGAVDVFVAGAVEGGEAHLFHGLATAAGLNAEGAGAAGATLADTGVTTSRGMVPLLGAAPHAGEPTCWVATTTGGARMARRTTGLWTAVDAEGGGFDWAGNSAQRAFVATGDGTIHGAVALASGTFDFKYALGYFRVTSDGLTATALTEAVALDQDDSAAKLTIRIDAADVPEIFHTETVALSTTTPVLRRRAPDGTWSRQNGPTLPVAVAPTPAGFRYVTSVYGHGPFGRTHVLEARVGDGPPTPISGDLLPIFQDIVAVYWNGDRPSFLYKDRDPEVPLLEVGVHRWVVPID